MRPVSQLATFSKPNRSFLLANLAITFTGGGTQYSAQNIKHITNGSTRLLSGMLFFSGRPKNPRDDTMTPCDVLDSPQPIPGVVPSLPLQFSAFRVLMLVSIGQKWRFSHAETAKNAIFRGQKGDSEKSRPKVGHLRTFGLEITD